MPLSIRNSKVEKLARQKAIEHGTTVTDVIGLALENLPGRPKLSFADFARKLSEELAAKGPAKIRKLTKEEINAEWMD